MKILIVLCALVASGCAIFSGGVIPKLFSSSGGLPLRLPLPVVGNPLTLYDFPLLQSLSLGGFPTPGGLPSTGGVPSSGGSPCRGGLATCSSGALPSKGGLLIPSPGGVPSEGGLGSSNENPLVAILKNVLRSPALLIRILLSLSGGKIPSIPAVPPIPFISSIPGLPGMV